MKKLSDVTREDAVSILSASPAYAIQLQTHKWILTDESEDIKEPAKLFSSKRHIFRFWFMSDSIDIAIDEVEFVVDTLIDVKLECYLKAVELGYYVPKLSELINDKK